MLTKKEILKTLNSYNLNGKPITVHCSLKAIGEIEGGAETLLSALKEAFTKDNGLLVIPTHTWDTRVLDLREPRTCIGVLPTISARQGGGVRSLHPTHSVTVFGDSEKAKNFVRGDEMADTPTNPNGSYGKLFDEGGYIFLIGVGQEKNTFIHAVEEMLNVPRYLKEKVPATVICKNGQEIKRALYWFDESTVGDVSVNFTKFEEAFNYFGAIKYGTLGNAKTQLIKAKDIKKIIELIYKNAKGKELLSDSIPLDKSLYEK